MPLRIATTGHILLVDDQPTNLHVVNTLLERQGYEVIAATNGEQALERCREIRPDLILLDMMMPGMDGFELLHAIKQDPQLMRIPTVFLTAAQDRDLLLRAFDAGAVDYVTKPFIPEELIARVNAHIVLKLTRDRLERVAQERQNLVNLVAHDLKNPLTSVLFASDMLMQPDVNPERAPRYLQIIHDATLDAISYIRSYLESQSSPAGEHHHAQVASLREAVEWLVSRYALQLEARGLRIQTRLPEHADQVAIDPMVLRQVAENLVTNAGKYATDGGELELWVRAGAPGYWQLVVQDRGPGIPAARQRELFKPFTRLSDTDPANGLSSGLGLSLARQIVMSAGGHLFYEDREGGGARFVIELPQATCTT
ncbi:hybrid sensor histidine kinase/response regulator [Solilutibacter pythonis]|uniref:hybrid sensor histidine kinase/response regulator n=1 Tax=Solilutibacter pythonis TaxID=2483112 RepID=UPI0013142AA7|nr:hybrid sensor histidine kinase/response regulator [Lysobacter pythonis]